jgi:hypothetical protein
MSQTSTKWIDRASLWERLRIAWKQFGTVVCEDCGQRIDLEDVETDAELEARWNDHVEEAGGSRYV